MAVLYVVVSLLSLLTGPFSDSTALLLGLASVALIAIVLLYKSADKAGLLTSQYVSKYPAKQALEDLALLRCDEFEARRCFQVAEFEDEGLHFFVELANGTVLYLNGQYLYEVAENHNDDGKLSACFPCTRFTLRRHRDEGYIVDIQCAGSRLYPAVVLPPFPDEYYRRDDIFQDGDVIADRSLDEVRRELEGG
jgi:hypothetical protein